MPNNDYILRGDALKAILGVSIYDTIEELEGARTIAESTWADGLYDAYKIIEEEVDAANVEPVRKWIPVTERLPENNGRYLVIHPLHNRMPWITVMYFGVPDGYDKGICFYIADDEWGDIPCDCVTHWMPLPEPPTEENHGSV